MINFPKPTVEQFFRTYVITDFEVNRDETRLIFSSNLNGKVNLWAMDLPDQFPYLFAQNDESTSFISFDPEGRYVLAGYDKDGDENHQIYALPYAGGLPQPLITGEPDEKYFFSQLSEDGNRLYYMTSEGNPSFLNTFVRNLENDTDTILHEGQDGMTFLSAVSEDEQAFVYTQSLANTYSKSFVKTEEDVHYLVPDPEIVHVAGGAIFTDNDTIYFITDYEANYSYLAKYELRIHSFKYSFW
jgi:hypothetical protein